MKLISIFQPVFKKTVVFCLIAQTIFHEVNAQDTTNSIQRVTISSPTAASLGKYGDIPVGYHTGIPNINVPIYTISSGNLSLPISLSYHASGLKVQENASWVGAGWTLNAGGAITRTVQGTPDDRGYNINNYDKGYFSDYGYLSYMFPNPNGYADDHDFLVGRRDGEPDLFFFNFGEYSGKFYFRDDRTPIIVPNKDFKIVTDYTGGSGFGGFVVTTPDGVQYYFGKTGNTTSIDPVEITKVLTGNDGISISQCVSSWFLNKIVSADGLDSIKLSYLSENYSYYTLALSPYDSDKMPQNTNGTTQEYKLVKNFVTGIRLNQISFANGTISLVPYPTPRIDLGGTSPVDFVPDAANTDAKALDSILVSSTSGFCKKYNFYYSYFHDNSALTGNIGTVYGSSITSDTYRLRLDSLKESSCDASVQIPPYKFSYFSETVPRKLSFGMDHWGFSNGVTTNQKLIPTYTIVASNTGTTYSGADRDPYWPAMRGGSLQTITYPTGGITTFEYEAHDAYVNYTQWQLLSRLNASVGYDGNSGQFTYYMTVSGNADHLSYSNENFGQQALMDIYDANNTHILSLSVNPGQTFTQDYSFAAGTYRVVLQKLNAVSAHGAQAVITEWGTVVISGNKTIGGLRIKTVTNSDNITSVPVVTSYNYHTGPQGQSSGILYGRPTYIQNERNDVYQLTGFTGTSNCSPNGCASCDGLQSGHSYILSPSSVRPMGSTQGSHIGYNEVDMSQPGNGQSVYRYYGSDKWNSVTDDIATRTLIQKSICDPQIPNYPDAPPAFEFMRDELKYEGYFNQNGLLLKEAYYYPIYTSDTIGTPGYITSSIGYQFFTEYELKSAKKTQQTVVTTIYDPVNRTPLVTTQITNYASKFHNQPTQSITYTSVGDTLKNNVQYAFDFRLSTCDGIPDSLKTYNDSVTASYNWFLSQRGLNTCGSNSFSCDYLNYQTYRLAHSNARIRYITYRRRSFSDPGNLFDTYHLTAKNGAGSELKPILELQDAYENPVIEQSSWKNSSLLHSNFTRYDYVTNPSGKVFPNKTQLVNLAIPSTSFTKAIVSGSSISKDSRYLDESIYQFSYGNPQQVTGKDGITYSYIWDYLNTEPIAKIINATSDQIAYTSFETTAGGGWTVPSTLRNTSSITGSQSYSLSNGSCSKSGLVSTNKYIVSYWSSTGVAFTITGNTSLQQGPSINGWTYFEHVVTGTTSVSVSGSGNIDELRLYPKVAMMTTYTYLPLVGMTSSCDENNRITYYFFDQLGRLRWQKDKDGNIVKTIQYHYKGQTTNQ